MAGRWRSSVAQLPNNLMENEAEWKGAREGQRFYGVQSDAIRKGATTGALSRDGVVVGCACSDESWDAVCCRSCSWLTISFLLVKMIFNVFAVFTFCLCLETVWLEETARKLRAVGASAGGRKQAPALGRNAVRHPPCLKATDP